MCTRCDSWYCPPFSIAQDKRYIPPAVVAHSLFYDVCRAFSHFSSSDEDDYSVHLTEVIDPRESRASSVKMSQAKRDEIKRLLQRGTFSIILREEVPKDANILPDRLFLALKSADDGQVNFKARYVVGGHRDRMKGPMVHTAATLQPQSIRLLLALAPIHGFDKQEHYGARTRV